jgi:hypothetical protein
MEWQSDEMVERMGLFHNAVIKCIDECSLSPPEAVMVLRLLSNNIDRMFEAAVKAKREPDGGRVV